MRRRTAHDLVRALHVIVTVTLNAAFDRTITVPNFQRGQRHRASAGLPLAGGKGINVARALKTLGVPVVATGLAGGQAGLRIVERLTAEAILNDFVRIEGESRTSTAVVDPTSNTYTEINEWGPVVRPEELEIAAGQARLPLAGRASSSSSPARCRGTSPRQFYAELIHELARRHVPAVLDCDGEPLRFGIQAEPFLVSPNQSEAESLVGQEFHDDEDFQFGLDRDRRARRAQRDHHLRERLLRALARRARDAALPRARAAGRAGLARSAPATCCSRRSSPRAVPAAPTRTRCARPWRRRGLDARARRRPLRPAPGPAGSRPASRSSSSPAG